MKDETTVFQFTKASGTGGGYPDPGNNKPVQSYGGAPGVVRVEV